MVGHVGSSAGLYLANPASPIPSHRASIVATSTLRVNPNMIMSSCTDSSGYLVKTFEVICQNVLLLTLTVLVMTIDAQWEGMVDVGSARYEPALLPPIPRPTIRVSSYSN